MTTYDLWGLKARTDAELEGLAVSVDDDRPVDVELMLSTDNNFWAELEGRELRYTRVVGDEERLDIFRVGDDWVWTYPDDTEFWIQGDGGVVRARWPANYTVDDALTYLVGPIMGFVLRLRGISSLHAGSVVVDGRAALFVGGATAGKSTLTGEFVRRGYRMLSDDVTPVVERRDEIVALRAVPVVKLWSDAARRHGELPAMSPSWPKRILRVHDEEFADRDAPISHVFLLGCEAGPVPPAEALAALMQNVYVGYAADREGKERDLELLAKVVERVPILGLPRAADLSSIEDRVDAVLEAVR